MAESDRLRKGADLRRQLLGDHYVERLAQTVYHDPLLQEFLRLTTEHIFGGLWTRPGLDLKTRTLVTVVADVATAQWPELAIHLRMARRQGWTESELTEALLHLIGYLGAPPVREALLTASRVFAELRSEGEAGS